MREKNEKKCGPRYDQIKKTQITFLKVSTATTKRRITNNNIIKQQTATRHISSWNRSFFSMFCRVLCTFSFRLVSFRVDAQLRHSIVLFFVRVHVYVCQYYAYTTLFFYKHMCPFKFTE